MTRGVNRLLSLFLCLGFFLISCSDLQPQSAATPTNLVNQIASLTPPNADETRDSVFRRIALVVPKFGGMYREDGKVYLHIEGLDELSAIQAATIKQTLISALINTLGVEGVLIEGQELSDAFYTNQVVLLPAQFNYVKLTDWFTKSKGLASLDDLQFVDLNPVRNRIVVGILEGGSIEAVEQRLNELGIPREAVRIEETAPNELAANLQSAVRPMVGGRRIVYRTRDGVYTGCTHGFNVVRNGVRGFMVNAHCTGPEDARYITRGNPIYQYFAERPESTEFERVGTVAHSPANGLCSTSNGGRWCRPSDSAFIQIASNVTSSLGEIAQTGSANRELNGDAGSGTTTTSLRDLEIGYMGIRSRIEYNMVLDKMGMVTGWTAGRVIQDCVDFYLTVEGFGKFYYACTHYVNGGVARGDSGSPVFRYFGSTTEPVALFGMMFALNTTQNVGQLFIFNDMAAIQADMGPLTIF